MLFITSWLLYLYTHTRARPLYGSTQPLQQPIPRDRVEVARDELMKMMAEDELRDAVVLTFANKVQPGTTQRSSITLFDSDSCPHSLTSDGPPEFHDELRARR